MKLTGDGVLLKPGKTMNNELRGVGILGKTPSLNFAVYATVKERREVELALHKLNHACSQKNGIASSKEMKLSARG